MSRVRMNHLIPLLAASSACGSGSSGGFAGDGMSRIFHAPDTGAPAGGGTADEKQKEVSELFKKNISTSEEMTKALKEYTETVKTLIASKTEAPDQTNKITELENQVKTMKEVIEKASKGQGWSLPGVESEAKKFSVQSVIRGLVYGDWGKGPEKAIFDEHQKSANTSDNASGGFVIPVELAKPIIEALVAQQVLDKLGVIQIKNITGTTLPIPRQTQTSSAYWEAEEGALKETDVKFTQFNMTPHRVGAYTKISNRFLATALQGAEEMIRRDLFGSAGRKIDLAFFEGTGASGQPSGIKTLCSAQAFQLGPDGNTGKSLLLEDIPKFEGRLEDANAMIDGGRYSFVSHPRIPRGMKRERIAQYSGDAKGMYVMLPMSDANLKDAMGYDFYKTTQLAVNLTKGSATDLTRVFFGNWAEALYGIWSSLAITASNQAGNATGSAFLQDQVWVKITAEVDFQVRHVESFTFADDVIYPSS